MPPLGEPVPVLAFVNNRYAGYAPRDGLAAQVDARAFKRPRLRAGLLSSLPQAGRATGRAEHAGIAV
jgi:hypothetical protein